ncbi:MAG: recombinase RecA [Armatimonadetes bacterium]|jgi:recombination protein RecA|nr:recombinase RecA [Armatimonadota bacterium]MDI9584166.1 recombinase RecA [Acidobacteriota bacterium]
MAAGKKTPEDKAKALDQALSQIQKQYGEGAVMRLGQEPTNLAVEVIPTGSLALDIALGAGGLPRGRIVEIYGQEGSGKTTLTMHVLAACQQMGGTAAFIDAEHAFSRDYAAQLGMDLDNLLVSQPDTGEQALEICDALIHSGAVDAIVVDSVAALVPAAELEGDMGDSHVGLQARLMSQALRKLAGSASNSGTVVVFINQIREKIGVMFGNPETTPGGRALKFWASVRLELRRSESLKRGTDIIGNRVSVKVVKNKIAPPFRKCEFDIIYGLGISRFGSILDEAVNLDLVEKSGSWFNYGEERLGQGRDNAVEFLAATPDIANELEMRIRQAHNLPIPAYLTAGAAEQAAGETLDIEGE